MDYIMSAIAVNLGKQLASLRKDNGITQSTLSSRCGFSLHCIQSIENGRRLPSFKTLEKLCAALGAEFSFAVRKRDTK